MILNMTFHYASLYPITLSHYSIVDNLDCFQFMFYLVIHSIFMSINYSQVY